MIGHWEDEDFSPEGTTWENRITDGRHLYLINGTQFTPPIGALHNGFFTFDGSDDYIGAPTGPYAAPSFKLNNSASFTICMWVQAESLPNTSNHHFLSTGIITYSPIVTNGLQVGTGGSGQIMASFMRLPGTFVDGHSFPFLTQLGPSVWHMISVVNDASGERCSFFKDTLYCPISNNIVTSTAELTTDEWEEVIEEGISGTTTVEFGRKHDGSQYEVTASSTHLSSVYIYDRALTHSEIISNYNATKGGFNNG